MKINGQIFLPLLVFTALLGLSSFASAQSILQSSGNFTVLGGAAITNTDATTISGGNVGLATGAMAGITGFFAEDGGPAVITPPGGIIPTGSVTEQARVDLMQAATGLALMPSSTDLSGEDLGGMTLLPGVYTFNSTATLNGALTLDANGESNAVWVFQIGSTLTTSANSTVAVDDLGPSLGSTDGIFWDVGAAITFGADNLIAGNYLAGTAITVGATTSGSAQLLALAAITLAGDNISGGSWTGGLEYDDLGAVVPVPEPAAFLWLMPLGALSLVLWRRRPGANKLGA